MRGILSKWGAGLLGFRLVGIVLLSILATTQALAQDPPVVATRTAIKVLASPLEVRFTAAVSERLVKKYAMPPLEIESMLATPAVKAFCAGYGANTPDVVALPRQMLRREYNQCVEAGVVDIVELKVGFDALVLVVRKGERVFNMTPRAMYFALAAEVPTGVDFVPNTAKRWRDLSPRLPDLGIFVLGSENGTAINSFFKEFFMEGGCRGLYQFKVFYSALDRVKSCTTMRSDGQFFGIKAPIALNFRPAMDAAPPGAIGVVPYTVYQHNTSWLDLMPVDGVLPTATTIRNDDYLAVSPVRYYVKRRHMEQSLGGEGVVKGLYKFIEELMSEEAIGEGGYLDAMSLVIDDAPDRKYDRDSAMRLQPFRR